VFAVVLLFLGKYIPEDFSSVFVDVIIGAILLFVLALGLAFLSGWLKYTNYRFTLGENALQIKRGILRKEEIAIPYRQIQNVDINRGIFDRLIGISRLVILTAGEEDRKERGESEGVLPAIEKNRAEKIRQELIDHSNVQKVVEN